MKTLTLILLALIATGCSSFSMRWSDGEYFATEGSPMGIAAYDEHISALVVAGKAPADQVVQPHYDARKLRIASQAPGLQLGQKKQRPPK